MKTVITFIGLPGSGKTTLADILHRLVGGSRINADQIRSSVSCDLKFSDMDREIQAWRMGSIAAISLMEPIQITGGGQIDIGYLNRCSIVDFVCPTARTREVYNWAIRSTIPSNVRRFDVWMDTIKPEQSRYPDTAKLFQPPIGVNYTVQGYKTLEQFEDIARGIASQLGLI